MKILQKILIIFLFVSIAGYSQKYNWAVDYNYFFDNTEFSGSKYAIPQTMTGMHFIPSFNISFDQNSKIIVGTDILMLSGEIPRIHDFFPTIYYQYKKNNNLFFAGAFPRSKSIIDYSDFLFADSINYFRPNLNGIYWKLGSKRSYFNVWLDWTGHQSATQRETFYAGLSAKVSFINYFYADIKSYLFHYAKTKPSLPDDHVCDNAQAIISLGYYNPHFLIYNSLKIAVGIYSGFERERGTGLQDLPTGYFGQLVFDNKFAGFDSKLYFGDPRMILYSKYGNGLYWGNPLLQSGKFYENKFFIKIFNNKNVQAKLGYNLNFAEETVYHEQTLTLNVSLDNIIYNRH